MEMKVAKYADTIVVRKNDDVNEIIMQFANKHNLNDSKKAKLEKLVL